MGALVFAKNNTRSTRSICFAVSALVYSSLTLLSQGCSKTNLLSPLVRMQVINNQTEAVTVNFCTDPAVQQQSVVKMLIILDHSASNQKNYQMNPDGDGTPLILNPIYNSTGLIGGSLNISTSFATDPSGFFRYGSAAAPGTLLNYLSTLPSTDPQHYFALIDFNSITTTIPNAQPGVSPVFTNNVKNFLQAVEGDLAAVSPNPTPSASTATSDKGSTDYHLALQLAVGTIQKDIGTATSCAALSATTAPSANCPSPGVQIASSYVIVFASDGSPISAITGVNTADVVVPFTNPDGSLSSQYSVSRETNETIISDVQGIMAKGSNTKFVSGINLFSVYYYNPTNYTDQSAITLLQQMAKAGNGIYYQASTAGSGLNYTQFLPLARTIKFTLSDVFVTNQSVLWWTDGELHADTDMDGLPDDVEKTFGTDPLNRDTFGYGISDAVEYQVAQQKGLAPCVKNAQGICAAPLPNYAMNGSPNCPANGLAKTAGVWPSSDHDGMNDCEKVLLGDYGGKGLPDSNDDIVPDWLEFINGVPFQLNAPSAAVVTLADGVSNYQKIKGSLPVNYPLNQLLNVKASNYDLTQVSTSPVQDCYNLVVTGLPVIGAQNTVRVDIFEKSDLLQQSYIYHVGKKQFPAGANSVQFNDWTDAGEIGLQTWNTDQSE